MPQDFRQRRESGRAITHSVQTPRQMFDQLRIAVQRPIVEDRFAKETGNKKY